MTSIQNVKQYTAAPPEELLEFLNQKKENLKKETKIVTTIIPELSALHKNTSNPTRAIVYEGFRGLKTAINEAIRHLDEEQTAYVMGATNQKNNTYNSFWVKYLRKQKHTTKILFSDEGDFYRNLKDIPSCNCRIKKSITPAAVGVYGSVVLLYQYKAEKFILIEDKDTAQSFKNFFMQLWAIAEIKNQ